MTIQDLTTTSYRPGEEATPIRAAAHAAVPGPRGDTPPQEAHFKAIHYVVNYLEMAEVVLEVLYDLLAERRQFTFTSRDRVRDAFGIAECDIVARWADVAPTTFDLITLENVRSLGMPALWPALFDLLYGQTNDVGVARFFLRWIHTALCGACKEDCGTCAACDEADTGADQPRIDSQVLFQFQLNLLDQWFDLPHEGPMGLTFEQLLQLLQAVAAFRGIVAEALNFSFEDLKFREKISGDVTLAVDGVVKITLPEDAADFFSWSLDSDQFSLTLHFDEITLADESEFTLLVDAPVVEELRFPFGGSLNDLRLLGVDASLVVGPEHSRAHSAPFAPYHQFADVYFMERDGATLGRLDVRLDEARFTLAPTVLTDILRAGAAYLDLFSSSSHDIGDLDTALSDAAASAVRNLDDIGGLAGTLTAALARIAPNGLACATHDLHRPYLTDHLGVPYDAIRAGAEPGGVIIYNDGPPEPRPSDDDDGPIHYPPTDCGVIWPGILDELGPGPATGGGGDGRSPLLRPAVLDAVRIPTTYRAEYARRLAAAGPLPARQEAAARLLIDGLDVRSVRLLHARQIDRVAGTVAGVEVSPATLAALARLSVASGPAAALPFSAGGQLATPAQTFADAFTPLMDRLSPEATPLPPPSRYALESTLAARRGTAFDPGWVGLSVNSYAVDRVLRAVAGSELMAVEGEATASGRRGADVVYTYQTAATDATRLSADLTGADGAGPGATVTGLEVTLARGDAAVCYRVSGRMAMQPARVASGCLPDVAVQTVVTYAGCIGQLTGGTISDADYRDALLYRHFIFLEPVAGGGAVTEFELVSGDPDALTPDGLNPRPLLSAALAGMWAGIARVPVLFDPFYALAPVIDHWEARDGWLNVYERYALIE
ncbi:MAG TPA: hypothetical protein PLH39_00175 [Promineifilum sp.]|nr:hypothetical protein [Promineifilum sp.]